MTKIFTVNYFQVNIVNNEFFQTTVCGKYKLFLLHCSNKLRYAETQLHKHIHYHKKTINFYILKLRKWLFYEYTLNSYICIVLINYAMRKTQLYKHIHYHKKTINFYILKLT